ncbi:hypothetical protein CFO_g628 [Ceratocystis platani]|uniref:Uncharacterized protein n=1 Tax=Ceratocystis fimbriata f. sp. platani TaxID=88771 RepID=A0A0F8BWP6_CERFI|nr:hypothetical protein CFO_g628 [Ceratocystis platani]
MRAAAALGQALLHRHETYMADAERDRLKLVARIEELQNDKIELEACNEKTQKENKGLMNQIDMLNTSVQDADMRIMQLEANLLSSEQTVRRLENATARAADMERQIAVLENEQDTLRHTVSKTEAESRDTMQRWRRAERSIIILQEQMDRMEQEGKEERERHAEIIKRIERQREVERGLNTAAGRLKGAAAAKSLVSTAEDIVGENPGNTVVSHFVRDLLADNAHLQLDISAHFAVPNHAAGIHAIAEEDDGRISKGIQRRVTSLSIAEELAGLDDEAEFEFCEDDDDGDDDKTQDVVAPLRSLRRHVSHESIMSLSGGLDIHTLKARPSQLTLRPLGTASAVITDVVAQSTISFQSGSDIRSSLAGFVGGDSGVTVKVTADDSSDVTSVNSSSISNVGNSETKPGSVVRGWSKWVPWAGYSSTASAASTNASAATSVSTSFSSTSTLASDSAALATPKQTPIKRANTSVGEIQQPGSSLPFFRNSGVNQPGPLPRYWVSGRGRGRGTAAQALVDSLKNNV